MNASNHLYHTLFFDAGGTLITANPSIGRIYADVAGRFDIELDPEQAGLKVRRAFFQMREEEVRAGSPIHTVSEEKAIVWLRELVRRSLDEAVASPRFEEFFQALFAEFALPERYQLFPEARGVLDELRASGHRLGIISNWDYRLRPVLEGLGIAGLFETIVISANFLIDAESQIGGGMGGMPGMQMDPVGGKKDDSEDRPTGTSGNGSTQPDEEV